jgi:hypothetical protein
VFSFFVVTGYCYSRCICAESGATILRKGLCSLGLSATSQQYFSLRTNQPPATSQQYSSLRTNQHQHQPSATSQPNRLKDDAYLFYKDYAKLSGFSLRTARTSKETNHWVCSREGWHDPKKREEPAKTEKGSRRCGCPAYVKVKKDVKHNFWYFDHVQEAHNHKLEPSARMTRYVHTCKHMEDGISDIFNIMTKNGVPHQAALM